MNWYIFSIEPKSVLDERMHPIMRDIQFLTVILICILVMANIVFLFYNVRRRQELFRLAYKDSITGGDNFSNFKEKAKKYALKGLEIDKCHAGLKDILRK